MLDCVSYYYVHNALAPLLVPDVQTACVEGFIANNALVTRSRQIGNIRYFHGQQLLFPNISLAVGGILSKWTFAAMGQLGSVPQMGKRQISDDLQYPELQIWKRESSTANNYTKRMSFGGITEPSKVPGALNVYEYSIDSEIIFEVNSNDILGIYQPIAANSALSLAFIEDFGIPTHMCNSANSRQPQSQCILSSNEDFTTLPLVTVEIISASKSCI